MLRLTDIQDWISGLGVASADHVYIGKLDNKQQKSIGIYSRSGSGPPNIALGGLEHTTYDTRAISLLVHWIRRVKQQPMSCLRNLETYPA
jgi:hypothetical protein